MDLRADDGGDGGDQGQFSYPAHAFLAAGYLIQDVGVFRTVAYHALAFLFRSRPSYPSPTSFHEAKLFVLLYLFSIPMPPT